MALHIPVSYSLQFKFVVSCTLVGLRSEVFVSLVSRTIRLR